MSVPIAQKLFNKIPLYSIMIIIGMCTAYALLCTECKRRKLPADTAVDITLTVVPCGIIGARLYYVFMRWPQYAQSPLSILHVWEGGLAIYGGILGGIIGLLFYSCIKKQSFFTLTDAVLPCVLLAQSIGRWGNYFNMEAYGPQILNPALQFFPLGVQIFDGNHWQWHMAAFFYESMWNLIGFCFLWSIRKKVTRNGDMSCWYFLVYGSGRFMIEQLRTDSLYIGSLRASQWLSLLFCIAACILLLRHCGKQSLLFIANAFVWLSRFLLTDGNPLLLLTIQALAGGILIYLCRNKRGFLWGAILLSLSSLLFIILRMLHLPVSEGFSASLLRAFMSFSMPCCAALLYFNIPKEEGDPCQTEL